MELSSDCLKGRIMNSKIKPDLMPMSISIVFKVGLILLLPDYRGVLKVSTFMFGTELQQSGYLILLMWLDGVSRHNKRLSNFLVN